MRKEYSVNRLKIAIKVRIKSAATIRAAFAAKVVQRQLESSLLDSQRTKCPLMDVQRQLEPSLLESAHGPGYVVDRWFGSIIKQKSVAQYFRGLQFSSPQ